MLLALAFPPFDVGLLALVAPAPLLWAWSGGGVRAGAADGFLAGVAFFGILVSWTWFFGAVAVGPFVVTLAAYWAAAGAVAGLYGTRRRPGPLVLASVWVFFEAIRARWPFGGFSWGEVGYAFHDVVPLRALASWGGVPLLSFLAVLFAAGMVDAVERGGVGSRRALVVAGRWTAVIVLVVLAGGAARPGMTPAGRLRVAVLQGNDRNRPLTLEELRSRYLPQSHFALADTVRTPVDLLVMPESSLDDDPRLDPFLAGRIAEIAREHHAAVLANTAVPTGDGRLYNTNFLYDPDGRLVGTYVKQHPVPYGEYVPGRRWLGFVDELKQIPEDFAAGPGPRVFTVAGRRIGTLICFESAFADHARRYARLGAEALVVSTNNRSFRRSPNSAQHVAMGQLRAAETGRPVVQAAISGISAFIDADGDVLARTSLFERTTLVGEVTTMRGRTPYVRFGDWAVWGAAAVLVAGAWARRGIRPTIRRSVDSPS